MGGRKNNVLLQDHSFALFVQTAFLGCNVPVRLMDVVHPVPRQLHDLGIVLCQCADVVSPLQLSNFFGATTPINLFRVRNGLAR